MLAENIRDRGLEASQTDVQTVPVVKPPRYPWL